MELICHHNDDIVYNFNLCNFVAIILILLNGKVCCFLSSFWHPIWFIQILFLSILTHKFWTCIVFTYAMLLSTTIKWYINFLLKYLINEAPMYIRINSLSKLRYYQQSMIMQLHNNYSNLELTLIPQDMYKIVN